MRDELKARNGRRGRFTGTVKRFGKKNAFKGPPLDTVLLIDVKDEAGTVVTDHLWFTVGKQIAALQLEPGDTVSLEARVTPYRKGYRGRRDDDEYDDKPAPSIDYRLERPTKVRKIRVARPAVTLPLFPTEGETADGREKTTETTEAGTTH